MPIASGSASPLFLREAEVRRGLELLFFGYGGLMRRLDARLAEDRLGRAHQRALYFIARQPDASVGTLLGLLGVTKQSLGRTLGELETRGLIALRPGRDDRRQRLVRLTPEGAAIEAELFELLRAALAEAYVNAGASAVGGFWQVLEGLVPAEARTRVATLLRS
ncbi:MarR family winged helix-turn-helix transcriptional regulator [Sphingomonas morindae]|uniref:MarR family transcriptional regulator n=1 Tax=Sphingomonas morindae TaxID=1541170 RepID=A0ABY4X4Z7_9SPHN|nr:MarR family transcriptional regulator [Sphingomonas morindae]USI71912.1 MarR family transcriptional regulator [Sphingomonas morindae]